VSGLAFGMAGMLSHCGDGVTLPEQGVVSGIAVFDGDGQSGAAGAVLGKPLVVTVTDRAGLPVPSQEVDFTVAAGAGQVDPATAQTDNAGKASTVWTLGPGAGNQQVMARPTGASGSLVATFNATAVAGAGSTLALDSGDGQTGSVGSALPESLVVRVTDGFGNPVSGVAVQWSVLSGGGSISPETATSGDDGRAAAERVLGPGSGTQTAQASASGFGGSPVTFTHTAIPANPAALVLVSGDGQSAPAGFEVAESLVVHLEDANGNGIGGKAISWLPNTSSGSASPTSSTTDPNGFAATRWTLGDAAGINNNTLRAVFSGLDPVLFSATGTADVPTTLAKNGGDNQSGFVGTTLANPLSVKVTDSHNNPVQGVSVDWTANGGGSVSSPSSATDAAGIAQVNRTLGLTPGDYTTTAAVSGLNGSPVTFTSHATVGTASKLVFTSGPSNRVVGQPFAPALKVEIQDAGGNLIPSGASVTITSSQPGTLSGSATVNAILGVATFSNLAINTVGTGYTLTAHSGSLTDAGSGAFDVTQGSTTTSITSRNPSTSVVGQAVTVNYDINITPPGAGSLTGSVTVSDGAGGTCTGGINAGTGVGNCQITFSAAGSPSLTATYSGNANFQGSTSSAVSHTVNRANTTINITQDDPEPSVAGSGVTVHWQLTVSSPGAGTPTGTVTVTMNGGEPATCSAPVADGQCALSPAPTVTGSRTITATYSGDGNFNGDSDTEPHTVNSVNGAPTAVADAYSVNEDQALNENGGSGVLANDTDPDGDNLNAVLEIGSGPTHAQSFSLNTGNGGFDYKPAADFNGTDSFSYHATDGSLNSNTVTVTITVNPVNDDPSFTKGPDQEVSSLAGAQTIDNWATNISPGPNEAGQTVSFNVSTNHDEAFEILPAVSSSGTLTFKPNVRLDTVDVTVTVQAQDNLGATSQSQDFKIKIDP
jgi:hypothetical protein